MSYYPAVKLLEKPPSSPSLLNSVQLVVRASENDPRLGGLRSELSNLKALYPTTLELLYELEETPGLELEIYLNSQQISPEKLDEHLRPWLNPPRADWSALFAFTRRAFLSSGIVSGAALFLLGGTAGPADAQTKENEVSQNTMPDTGPGTSSKVKLTINGKAHQVSVDNRATVLDVLRYQLGMTGTKLGCNHGQCGACTVLLDDERVNSCLLLAVQADGRSITTIEGLSKDGELHPMQQAFIENDAFQCGYCTPGQICSAVGLMNEGRARTRAEIQEQMAGNICRCGAYKGIVDAIEEVIS